MFKYILVCFLIIAAALAADEVITVDLPERDPVVLTSYSSFDYSEIDESSALVKSRMWDDVYWTLNDSGDENRIFPVNRKGEVYRAEWYKEEAGIYIYDAVNVDWEDIATDSDGYLYIAACGNNSNMRRDLSIYMLRDPFPQFTGKTTYFRKIRFYFPEQTSFPPENRNFDCEALFHAFNNLYLLTKHRSDDFTCLYRFDQVNPLIENPVHKLGSFDIKGMVTAADATPDGKRLAVLTYMAVWLFESSNDDYFHGTINWLPISAGQCEAICFDGDYLLISNEEGELFQVDPADLIKVSDQ